MKKLELTGKSQSQIKTNLIEIMLPINPNNGKVNCAHVALKLDEILYNKELQDTKPVPKQDANLSTYPEYDMATGDIVKSFCADSRLVQRCLGSVPSLGVMDLTAENHVIVDLTDSNRPASPSNDTVKLYKTTYAQARDRLKDLPLRDTDGSAHGFILYTHKDKSMGHLTNFLVDANNNVYFLDAQDNKRPESFVRHEPAPGYCDEIFFVQSKPKNSVKTKLVKQENINQGVNPVTISTTTTSSVVQNNTIIGNTIHINCDTMPESITNLPASVECVQINKDANPEAVAKLPASVFAVQINKNANPAAVAKLPASVTAVKINKDANLEAVAKLPASVTAVQINKNANPAAVAKLPASVTAVQINKDANLEAVAKLPASVKGVGINKEANPEAVAKLPKSVIAVQINKNSNPEAVAMLPPSVNFVRIDKESNPAAIAKVPASVKAVIIVVDVVPTAIANLPAYINRIEIYRPIDLPNLLSMIQTRNSWPNVYHQGKLVLAAKALAQPSPSTSNPTTTVLNNIAATTTTTASSGNEIAADEIELLHHGKIVLIKSNTSPAAVEKLPASVYGVRIEKDANPAAVAKLPGRVVQALIGKDANPAAVANLPETINMIVIYNSIDLPNILSMIQTRNSWPNVYHQGKLVLAAKALAQPSPSTSNPTTTVVNNIAATTTTTSTSTDNTIAELKAQLEREKAERLHYYNLYTLKAQQLDLANEENRILRSTLSQENKRQLESSSSSDSEATKKFKPTLQ